MFTSATCQPSLLPKDPACWIAPDRPASGRISNLTSVRDTIFELWRDDLLVVSLKANALFRMRIRDDRVLNVEKIGIGGRIRDLVEGPEVRIALYSG